MLKSQPTPLFKNPKIIEAVKPTPAMILKPTEIRTTNPKTTQAVKMETPKTLIRAALKRVSWKTEHGLVVQLGIEGSVPDINAISSWLVENFDQDVILIDDCRQQGGSFLDGLKPQVGEHYNVPPTLSGRVRLYEKPPELKFPIHFLSVPTDERYGLKEILPNIQSGTMIFGAADACGDVLEKAELSGEIIYYCGGMLAVRAH